MKTLVLLATLALSSCIQSPDGTIKPDPLAYRAAALILHDK